MKIKLSQLKQSKEILEIRKPDPVTVSRYRQYMRNGAVFPPLIIEKPGNVIISGNHRYEAYTQEYKPDHEIEVIPKKFETNAERIEEAVRENSKHGKPLEGISRKIAISKLLEYERSPEHIAQLLNVSVKRIEEIGGISVYIRGETSPKPIKRGPEIMGKTITKKQYTEHLEKDRAVPAQQNAEQLTRWLRNGWVNLKNENTIKSFQELHEEIENHIMELV